MFRNIISKYRNLQLTISRGSENGAFVVGSLNRSSSSLASSNVLLGGSAALTTDLAALTTGLFFWNSCLFYKNNIHHFSYQLFG